MSSHVNETPPSACTNGDKTVHLFASTLHNVGHSLARTVTRCGPSSLPSASSVAALAARKAASPFSRLKGVSRGSPASCSVTLDA
eukprot:scaffold31540_cov63-Phaeocystis_antarctica.AAC.3